MPARVVAVDCLRGLAAGWVVAYHLWAVAHPGANTQERPGVPAGDGDPLFWPLFLVAQYGYAGVTLFFVLSGFCIHLPFAGGRELRAGPFLRRRFWRLYPAYVASIVLVLAADAVVRPADPPRLAEAGAVALFLQNAYPPAFQFNSVYWTLLYEVQFYLLYPVLLPLVRRHGATAVLAGCLAVEVGLSYFPLPVKACCLNGLFEWFLGAWLADRWAGGTPFDRGRAVLVGLLFGGLFVLASVTPWLWPVKDTLAATGFAGLLAAVLASGGRQPPVRASGGGPGEVTGGLRPPLARTLGWLGTGSYSLYLTHLPVLDMCGPWLGVPVAVGVAWLFFRLFERPFLRTGGWVERGFGRADLPPQNRHIPDQREVQTVGRRKALTHPTRVSRPPGSTPPGQ
jgi:peptidoglycan/LPS O-acetylase OafA/YrhL